MLTYANNISDINLKSLLEFHNSHGKLASIATVHPRLEAGRVVYTGDQATGFEKRNCTLEDLGLIRNIIIL